MNVDAMNDEQLQRLARDLHEQVMSECFSSKDHLLYIRAVAELERRGFRVDISSSMSIARD